MTSAAAPETETPPPGTGAIFLGFLSIGVMAFGGALPIARRTLVERLGWLTPDAFTELLSLAQFLPGPNIVNLSVVVGKRLGGAAGALAAFLGLAGVPAVIAVLLGVLFTHYADVRALDDVLAGLAAAAAGLVIAMAARLAEPMWRRPTLRGWAVALAAFGAVGLAGLPLVWVMAVLAPISVVLAWRALP